ncbi:polycystin-1-like [Anabas testudineus]|uniref:polycystin-1-like n=1 Tax=Anabas testudineus TaxID=64144 RepID=UPI000E4658AD|nr:polycystin-1-like [Anabas testudineus]
MDALWILCALLILAAGENIPCPEGARIHLSSLRCYWLSETTSSWSEAQDSCRETHGGDLATANSLELENFMHYSFPVETTVWVWLKGSKEAGSDRAGIVEPSSPVWWTGLSESAGGCSQMALGTFAQWRRAQCAAQHRFLCEKELTDVLPPVDSYLTGLVVMSGVYAQSHIPLLLSVPHTGQDPVELQLFPGLWFSHAGQLVTVELVVSPNPLPSLARVQILRPYCDPNLHLVPPGCSSLHNPFSCCSAVPLCNTTGGCSIGQYWCHLLDACVPTTSPCSPYDPAAGVRGFALPPRYPEIPPFYHMVADLPMRINPSSELKTMSLILPDQGVMVYPDDIVAIQHTRNSGTFLHCLKSASSIISPWSQSYLSLRGAEWKGWWNSGHISLAQEGQWVDGVVCDLRMLYVDNLHRGTELEDIFGFTHTMATTAPDVGPLTTDPTLSLRTNFELNVIHPLPDEKNQIHVLINVPTVIVIKVLSGEKAKSSWSAPVLRTGVPFLPSCPEEVPQPWPGCKGQFHEAWFSSVTLLLTSVGVQTMNISAMDAMSSESVSVKVCGYEAVSGLSVDPHGPLRMLVDMSQSFTAKVESGSSVKLTWVIDNLDKFAYEGETYSVLFKKPAEYKLTSQEILLTADEMIPLSQPEFLFVKEVIAINVKHLYHLRIKVDISLPVTFRWDFGDGCGKIIHTHSAPYQTMAGLMERKIKHVYVHDSVNYTYSIPDNYTLYVQVANQFDNIETTVKMNVRPQLSHIHISSSPLVPLVKQTLYLEASTEPSTYSVVYTWDFGDGSRSVQGINHRVSHIFGYAGVYNVTVCANNTLTALTTWLMVEVMEKISRLTISYNGPSELGSVTELRAEVATGNSLIWNFDFGDGSLQENHTDGSVSHIYNCPGNYTVDVTVSNYVSKVHESIKVEVYRLAVSGVLPTECVINGEDIELIALVNGNISNLMFHWQFGDGSPLAVVTGQSSAMHSFSRHGIFNVSLTVFSSVTSVSFNTSICIEASITNMVVKSSQEVAAVGEEVCFSVLVSPQQMRGYQFKWFSNSLSGVVMTENTQKCFVFKDEGVKEVLVMASNTVSNKTAEASITVQKPVSKLSVMYGSQSDALTVNTLVSFWVASCTGSNVSMLWDYGDGSPLEKKYNVSHVFTSTGQFTVKATAFNTVSQESVTLTVNIVPPISDLTLHINQSYAVVGEEVVIIAVSSAISSTNYYWTVDNIILKEPGTYEFRFVFPKPGVFQVRVIAQNLVSRKEAAILIEVFERTEGLQIECPNITDMKYVPTQEELRFIASITKGSNVTYHWLAIQSTINQQITGDGALFHLFTKKPGKISVELKAFNKLGEATSVVSLTAVERVTGAYITLHFMQSNTVALGKLVNISVSVVTGSDLEYLWYVDSDPSPLQTQAPFLLHTFMSLGNCLVRVSVQNVLSQSNDTKLFVIQEEVQDVDFLIEGKTHPFYVNSSAVIPLCGIIRKGSGLYWNWKVRGPKINVLEATNQTFFYNFPHAGTYQVFLNVSNGINWQVASHRVIVQDRIEGLRVNISKSSLCDKEKVTLCPTITMGSNISFVVTFRNNDWIHSQNTMEGKCTTLILPVGSNLVTVKAWNQVSSSEVSTNILVIEHIDGLRLVNCCSVALEALKMIHFKAEVQNGSPVNYTWRFYMVGSEPIWSTGQDVFFTPAERGSLSLSVVASNGVCSHMLNETIPVEWPVKKINLVCYSERIFVGHAVRFSATVNGGSNRRYLWDFGDSTEVFVTELSTVNHTYFSPGKYRVMIKVVNSVSHVSKQLHIHVEELQCSSPQASLTLGQNTILRSRPSIFEASININCSAYKTMYLWEIFRESNCTSGNLHLFGNRVILSGKVDTTSPLLLIPKNTLNVGEYCLVFTISLHGTPLFVQEKTNITVIHSPLIAIIKGGSQRLWSNHSDLILDGSESQDPDVEPGVKDSLQYHWTFLTVVTVSEAPVLPVTVECVSHSSLSSPHHISYTKPVTFAGRCAQCDNQAQFKWKAESQTGMILDLDEVTTSTGRYSPNLVVHSGVLQPGLSYTFILKVSLPGTGQWGTASLSVLPNSPPHGGLCDLSPESDIFLLETVVTYNCSGWQDDESEASQLIYSLQVAPCQTISTLCPMLILYRGIQSTFSSLVPSGSQRQGNGMSVITVTLLVEDHLGEKVTALNRTLTVKNPARDEVASNWLRRKTQTELWALVQHGNPREIVPYSIALTSHLNQMQSTQSVRELMDRRKIRENVTQALASLPMSSMLDVDQISSALAQSTAVPSELVCENCQKQILKAVGKMIHLMEEQMIPHALSAVHTGRNIFNILGSTLAAVSEAVSASNAQSAYWSSLESASTVAVSALSHTGALIRSLMRSRLHGEAPLLLTNPYVSTFGYKGAPSDLLCAHRSNQPRHNQTFSQTTRPDRSENSHFCLFHIPSSLTARLNSQRSEVVQVLFGIDGALESFPLLTAADPPISTSLVAMELTTPQGQPIPIEDLEPEQAIRVTLPNRYPVGQENRGEAMTRTCSTVTVPTEGQLSFMVQALDDLDENAGLYLSFNFSLAPGGTPVKFGHVKIEVSSTVPGSNASQDSLVREWPLTLCTPTLSTEKTIFLSPLSVCQYYNVMEQRWSTEGLQPLEGSTLHTAHCLTQHLTMFGASLFVHPGAIVPLPPSGGPVRNVVVGIVCAVLVLIHLLVGLIAHKLDHLDSLRLSQVPLCGRPGMYHYRVLVKTGWKRRAGTTAHVGISLHGVNKSGSRHLQRDGAFQRGSLDQFHLETDDNLGEVWKIRIWHDNTGLDPSWYVQHVVVWDTQTDHMFFFLLDDWLSVENHRNGTVEKEVLASCPEELFEFRRVLTSQLMFGIMEHHMWLSLWERPSHSRFTRGQRVTCSAIILHLYLALGALWYGAVGTKGHSGPVSAQLLVNMETVAVGMTLALLVFPLQCFLCFLFRKAHSQITVDMSVPPSPVCHSVEMDVYLGQSELSGPSFLSLSDSSGPVRDTSTSLLESKGLDSSILDFWAASGLVPQTHGASEDKGAETWSSCGSLLNLPLSSCPTKITTAHDLGKASPVLGSSRPLRRKKALMELCPVSLSSPDTPSTLFPSPCQNYLSKDSTNSPAAPGQNLLTMNANLVQAHKHNLTTFLTLSEEDLLMSIAAAAEDPVDLTKSNSDSGWDSPRTTSSLSTTWSNSCSSWTDQSEDRFLHVADVHKPDPQSTLYKCASVLSVNSVASTFLPSPSPDFTRSSSTTRIGVARGPPSWLLPPWALCVIYSLVAVLLGACLAVIGLYGSSFSRTVVLMWLVSALCAFLTSALLLEPLKVCSQALIYTTLWRPVDPEVEEQLAQETTVVRAFGEHCKKVRPLCGYGLLQAKEEARKVHALRSLMRHCVCQLLFLLLVLMVNYQDSVEQSQGRLLHSAVRRCLHTALLGVPNLASLRDWSDAERWINHTLVHNLHQNPSLRLVGLPQLRYTHTLGPMASVVLGNSSVMTRRLLADLRMVDWSTKMFKTVSIDFTHYHRESGLFVCVSVQLVWALTQTLTPSLSIYPLLIPSSFSWLDLQTVLMVLLFISALIILFGELRSMATERAHYLRQCRHWLQLLLALLSLATAILQLSFLSLASSCVSKQVLCCVLGVPAAENLKVCAEVGGDRQSVAESLEGAVGSVCSSAAAAATLHSPWKHVEGFLSAHEASVSALTILRGRIALHRLCKMHPVLGPLYGLLMVGAGFWLLARLCGAVLIQKYREERAELYHPNIEPQDYEMVEFFIKRLKLWMGLTKTKEFRHRVTFEGMDIPPSRSSRASHLSTISSTLPSSRSPSLSSSLSSPRSLWSALSDSENLSVSEPGFDVQPHLDRLVPRVTALLSHFDRVTKITEDVHNLEVKLEEAQARRRKLQISHKEKGVERLTESENPKEHEGEGRATEEVRHRKMGVFYPRPRFSLPSFSCNTPTLHSSAASICIFLRTQNSYSESDTVLPQVSSSSPSSEATKSESGICGLQSAGSPAIGQFPRRRAWHSGSSHSADAARRAFLFPGGAVPCGEEHLTLTNTRPRSEEGVKRRISDGVPVKRKAWISEGPETEQG